MFWVVSPACPQIQSSWHSLFSLLIQRRCRSMFIKYFSMLPVLGLLLLALVHYSQESLRVSSGLLWKEVVELKVACFPNHYHCCCFFKNGDISLKRWVFHLVLWLVESQIRTFYLRNKAFKIWEIYIVQKKINSRKCEKLFLLELGQVPPFF